MCFGSAHSSKGVFGIFCHAGHWSAFAFDRIAAEAWYLDGIPGAATRIAGFCIKTLSVWLDEPYGCLSRNCIALQTHGSHCGAIALAHVKVAFLDFGSPLPRCREFGGIGAF